MKKSNHHLSIFCGLTYGLTWLFWIPTALSGRDVTTTSWVIPYMLGGFGPSVAGTIMFYQSKKREERADYWKRVIDFKRITTGWYLFILLIFPTLISISFLFDSLLGNPLPSCETLSQLLANPLMLIAMVAIGIIAGPLSEELGWRGFALDCLQERCSPLVSSLILAPFWWGWHLPLFFLSGTPQSTWGIGTISFWIFLIGIFPLSILFTWVYNHNERSILSAILLHFMYNFTLSLVYPISATVSLFLATLLFFAAIGMVIVYKPR